MGKGVLKNFALWARKKLKTIILHNIQLKHINIDDKTIEKITYLWFIRFVIIRVVEVKGFLPRNLKMFKLEDYIYTEKQVLSLCEYLSDVFPCIFNINLNEKMLFSFDTEDFRLFLHKFKEDVPDKYFEDVEIIGWFHQFYMMEEHENIVGMNNGTINAENIPAATQLFTPKWIVKYMVDNSLGRLWVEGNERHRLRESLDFYIENSEKNSSISYKSQKLFEKLTPENIKFLDPACGAGHILTYAFDVLYNIYLSEGYNNQDIPMLILNNNLYGLDIDETATNLAKTELIIKSREKDFDFFSKIKSKAITNILCIKSTKKLIRKKELLLNLSPNKNYGDKQIDILINTFLEADELGSIIEINNFDINFWASLTEAFNIQYDDQNFFELKCYVDHVLKQAEIMSQKYHVVCTNPPYMSKKYMDKRLKQYIKLNFLDFSGDLFSVFMIRNLKYTKPYGYAAFMTPFVWMFIKEYEKLRRFIIDDKTIISLVQLEYSAYIDATVPICTFIIGNFHQALYGEYIKLSDFKGSNNQPLKVLEAIKKPNVYYRYCCPSEDFKAIPAAPIAFWISKKLLSIFKRAERLEKYIDITGSQNITSNNDKYLRRLWEVNRKSVNKRWKFYTKGGEYRKWYGNIEYLVDWCDEAKKFYKKNKTANLLSDEYCFRDGITYNGISIKGFAAREVGKNIYDKGGPTFHILDESLRYYILALLNSKVIESIMQIYNPTINYQVQDIKNIPVIISKDSSIRNKIDMLTKECIELSKNDWNLKETSWEFKEHPFLKYRDDGGSIEKSYCNWREAANASFKALKEKEEELNKIFITIYGLKEELSSKIEDRCITIEKAILKEDLISFISFGVGCIFGRYKFRKVKDDFKIASILPITKEKYFEDDITNKFKEFLISCYGSKNCEENLNFIAEVLGRKENENAVQTLNRYFRKYFYKDHIRIYKKRPIYWMFTSGEQGAFNSLIYIHTFDKEVLKNIKVRYVDKLMNIKENKNMVELNNYSMLLEKYINNYIELDIDNGIVINYSKLEELMYKI